MSSNNKIKTATTKPTIKKTAPKIIPIFFATDDNYVPITHVAIQSMLANASKKYNYNIHILCVGMKKENKKSFNTFASKSVNIFVDDISETVEKRAKLMPGKYYGGMAAYIRVFIPRLYPQYKKIVYLDGDIAINGDISEMYNTPLGSNYIGAVVESVIAAVPIYAAYIENFVGISRHDYINSGIYTMDCVKARKMDYEGKFFEILTHVPELDVCPDQDCLNIICRGKIKFLDGTWNITPFVTPDYKPEEVKIAHYKIADKPWLHDGVAYADLFWEHAKNTIFYEQILAMKENFKKECTTGGEERKKAISALAEKLANSGKNIDGILKEAGVNI